MPDRRPTFSLVFLTWNAADVFRDVVSSLRSQTFEDFEVVVVDNASADDTVAVARELEAFAELTLVENAENLGFTRGINRGIDAASGEYVCCYNHDTTFPADYLSILDDCVSPETVWTTARVNHRTSTEHRCVRLLGRWRFPIPYIVDGLSGTVRVNYVPGDGVIIPREIVTQRSEVFDPGMPEKGEDVEFSLWLQQQDIPMRAVLETYSVHPDEGPYAVSIENGIEHLRNVYARYRAYRRHGLSVDDVVGIAASAVTVPYLIYGSTPKAEYEFVTRTRPDVA